MTVIGPENEGELGSQWNEGWNSEPTAYVRLPDIIAEIETYYETGEETAFNVRDKLRRKYKTNNFVISAEVKIVKGKRKRLVLNQPLLIATLYGIDPKKHFDLYTKVTSGGDGENRKNAKALVVF